MYDIDIEFPRITRRNTPAPVSITTADGTPIYYSVENKVISIGTLNALSLSGLAVDTLRPLTSYSQRLLVMYTYYAPYAVFDNNVAYYYFANYANDHKYLSFVGDAYLNAVGDEPQSVITTNLHKNFCVDRVYGCYDDDVTKVLMFYEEDLLDVSNWQVRFVSNTDTLTVGEHTITGLVEDGSVFTGTLVNLDSQNVVNVTLSMLGIKFIEQTDEFKYVHDADWSRWIEPPQKVKICVPHGDIHSSNLSLYSVAMRDKTFRMNKDCCIDQSPKLMFAHRRNTFMFNFTDSDDVRVYRDGCCIFMCLTGDSLIEEIDKVRYSDTCGVKGIFLCAHRAHTVKVKSSIPDIELTFLSDRNDGIC